MSNNFNNSNLSIANAPIIFVTIEVVIGTITILFNSIVLALYSTVRLQSGKSSRKYFVAMASADLLHGLIAVPLAIFVSLGVRTNDKFCLESIATVVGLIFISLFLMICMSVDRYCAIIYPLKYKVRGEGNDRLTYFCIFMSSIAGIMVGVALYYTADDSKNPEVLCFVHTERTSPTFNYISAGLLVVPSIVLFLCIYIRIFGVIMKAMSPTTLQKGKFAQLGEIVVRKNTAHHPTFAGIKHRDIRATGLLLLTIIMFFLSWVPGLVLLTILRIYPEHSSLAGTLTVYVLAQLNSMINPILYSRNIRHSNMLVLNWIKCLWCADRDEVSISAS